MKTFPRLPLLLTLFALALSACGSAAPATPAAPAAEQPSTGAAVAPAASGEKAKVVWWTENVQPVYQEALKRNFIDPFNAAHPNIELEITYNDKLDEVLRTAMQGGAGPDLVQTPGPAFVAEYVAANLVTDMDAFNTKYGWDKSIFPWAIESGKVNGKLYSLPLSYETMVMWYNKKTFAENGWTVPTTRAELEQVAEAAKAKGMFPFVNGNASWKGVNEWLVSSFYGNVAGAETVHAALTQQKSWDDPTLVDSISLLNDYMQKGYFRGGKENYFATEFTDINTSLASNKGVINFAGTWDFQNRPIEFKDNPNDWDWAPVPALRDNVTPSFPLGIGSTLSINAATKNPEAVAEVINWIYNDPKRAAQIIHDFPGEWVVPIKLTKADFPADTDPRFIRALETLADASAKGQYGYTTWTFWPAKSDQYIIEKMDSVFNGQLTPQAFSEGLQAQYAKDKADGKLPPVPARP